MRIALCDDEPYILTELESFLEEYAKINNSDFSVVKFISGDDLLNYMRDFKDIKIIFLDIKMPDRNGFEVAHEIRKNDTKVKLIFLTALTGLVKEGYKFDAVSYITKPILFMKLRQELKRVINKIELEDKRYIVEKNDSGIYKLYLTDILYIETEK